MNVLFVSNYFPPEVNAPAVRLHDHARLWVEEGGHIEVLTAVPNFPEGVVYKGYRNRLTREEIDGIPVTRVPVYLAENRGRLKRALSYASFMLSAIRHHRRVRRRPDVVAATSPQLLVGAAGYVISRLRRVPFVLEIRDLWPESIVAVGAMHPNLIIRTLERLGDFLYHKADRIVVVTDSFKRILAARGIDAGKIVVLKNGVVPGDLNQPPDPEALADLRRRHDLEGKFVAAYVGTIGMAHRADILLEAARLCRDPDIVFMVIGAGAARAELEARASALQLPNFRLIEKQPREVIRHYLNLMDVSVIHLRDDPVFRAVLPSKLFEAMITGKPMVLGVLGEAKEVLEEADAGIAVPPEDAAAIVAAVTRLRDSRELYRRMSRSGRRYVVERHDRATIARRYWALFEEVNAEAEGRVGQALTPAGRP
ncbi:MAG: glycosyltransferase family 4 protein [Armatimonadetes bacterium]|nr:glycosyltransferase family 4 protein [Armatimonadota bacterium]